MEEIVQGTSEFIRLDNMVRNHMPTFSEQVIFRLYKAYKMEGASDGYHVHIHGNNQTLFVGVLYESTGLYLDARSTFGLVFWLTDLLELRMKQFINQYNAGHWPYRGV